MDGAAFDGVFKLIYVLLALAPFGAWKIIEIIIWIKQNVNISIG